jgi:predicted nucleotidyltransferase
MSEPSIPAAGFMNDPQFTAYIRQHALHAPLALMVHGSWADGFAGPDSDIDVLALTEAVHDSQPLLSPFGKIHIEYCPYAYLEQEIQKLDDQYRHRILDFSFLVARLRAAVVLDDPQGYAQRLLDPLQSYRPSEKTRRKFYIQAIAFRNDAVSSLQSGDPVQAIIASRLAAMSLCAGHILNQGVTNLNLKWQHHFLQRLVQSTSGEAFFNLYQQVMGLDSQDAGAEAQVTVRRLLKMMELYDQPAPAVAPAPSGQPALSRL